MNSICSRCNKKDKMKKEEYRCPDYTPKNDEEICDTCKHNWNDSCLIGKNPKYCDCWEPD